MLKQGAVAVLGEYVDSAELRAAAERNDLVVLARTRPTAIVEVGRADLAVFDDKNRCLYRDGVRGTPGAPASLNSPAQPVNASANAPAL